MKSSNEDARHASLAELGYKQLIQQPSGINVHRLDNVMTLSTTLYTRFDNMDLWLEQVQGLHHRYRIKLARKFKHSVFGLPTEAQFEAREGLPLPNPEYLRLHAMCCRVLHLSGAAEYIDKMECASEDHGALVEDGSMQERLADESP
ncbi:hypothetical protein OH77DRAFT_1418134 [Trametes cingulata]|nr:hypothetical protein OH77DRAFT_1418134 [Trametes cingulata]